MRSSRRCTLAVNNIVDIYLRDEDNIIHEKSFFSMDADINANEPSNIGCYCRFNVQLAVDSQVCVSESYFLRVKAHRVTGHLMSCLDVAMFNSARRRYDRSIRQLRICI